MRAAALARRAEAGGATPGEGCGAMGSMRGSAKPIDRREEMPTRKVASATEAPVPARAATGRRRRARAREAPPERQLTARLFSCGATCARRGELPRRRGRMRHTPTRHATSPPFPAAPASRLGPSAPRRAEAPESFPMATTDQVSRSCGLRGAGSPPPCRRCPGHLSEGLRCPSGAPIPSWGTLLPRRFGGCRGRHRVALRRREPPIERYEPKAEAYDAGGAEISIARTAVCGRPHRSLRSTAPKFRSRPHRSFGRAHRNFGRAQRSLRSAAPQFAVG